MVESAVVVPNPENLDLVISTYTAAHNHLVTPVPAGSKCPSGLRGHHACVLHTDPSAEKKENIPLCVPSDSAPASKLQEPSQFGNFQKASNNG